MKAKDLKQDSNNYRKHSDTNKKRIKKSIDENGLGRSVLVDADGVLIAGNGVASVVDKDTKVRVVETDGTELVVVKRTDLHEGDARRKALALADNATSDGVEWDFDAIEADGWDKAQLSDDWGVEWDAIEQADEAEAQEDDFDPDAEVETVCKAGDIWRLGDHRLMCGDSTDAGSVALLMDGKKADLCFTDPPYGMKKESEGVLNDNQNADELLNFNKAWIPTSFQMLKDNGSWYCWGIDEPLMDIYGEILKPMIVERNIMFRNLITWDKGNGQGQNAEDFRMYAIADEKCLFVMKGSIGFYSMQDFKIPFLEELQQLFKQHGLSIMDATTIFQKMRGNAKPTEKELKKSSMHFTFPSVFCMPKKEYWVAWFGSDEGWSDYKLRYEKAKDEWRDKFNYFDNTHDNMNNVWHFDRAGKDERVGHATPKPIALCVRAIKTSSREGEAILDLFGGSGSTLIAAEQLNRRCYMMELDPHYCDVIIARWEKLTGRKAEKVCNVNEQ